MEAQGGLSKGIGNYHGWMKESQLYSKMGEKEPKEKSEWRKAGKLSDNFWKNKVFLGIKVSMKGEINQNFRDKPSSLVKGGGINWGTRKGKYYTNREIGNLQG